MEFNNEEIEIIAKDFGISEENAQGIVQLLKSCFDKEVRFHRATFEKHIAQFAEYEESVFDILWYYLKEISNRKDRVGFLNALQVLIGKMKKPENALKVLLEDFIRRPDKVAFPDRNIFILSNILVRKYNQEVNLDIELTPEAVLDVYHGLNSEVVKFAAETIDDYQDKFFQKIRTIHKKLLKSIVRTNDDIDEMPLKYLLSLERETFIFFALVQGETSLSILRSALKEYGDPRCEVYQIGQDLKLFSLTLPHLKLIVRAVGRLKDKELVGTLNKIREREMAFLQLGKGVQHEQLVRRVMETADKSIDKILSRPKTPLTEGLTVS
jgi:hypothetical protein